MPNLAGNKQLSVHFPHRPRLFHPSTEKYVFNPSEMDIKMLIRASTHLTVALRVATCSTARRGATEKNEKSGHGTGPCWAKMTQRSSTVEWKKFKLRHQIGSDGTRTEQIFTFKVTLFLLLLLTQALCNLSLISALVE